MSADCVIIPFRGIHDLPTVAESNDIDTLRVSDAVDADEVAAVLEANGINDTVATERYGHPDVFALASSVHSSQTRLAIAGFVTNERRSSRKGGGRAGVPVGETLLRGVTFAVPGLTAAGLPALSVGPRDQLAVMVAVVIGWAVSQGLAGRGYLRLAVDKADARRATATAAGLIALVAGGLATASVWWLGVSPRVGAVAAAQVVYAAAATTALLFGGVRLTLLALVPAALAAVSAGLGRPAFEAAAGFTLSLLLVCAVAAWRVGPALGARPARSSPDERRVVSLYVGYGAALATLLMSGLAVWESDPVVLALVISIVAIEYEVVRLLTRGRALLRSSIDRRLLEATGWRLLGFAMLRYAVLTATLAGVFRPEPGRLVWVLATGLVFLVGGVLVTHHGVASAVVLVGPAAAIAVVLASTVLVTSLMVALAVALTVVTGVRLGRPEAHR